MQNISKKNLFKYLTLKNIIMSTISLIIVALIKWSGLPDEILAFLSLPSNEYVSWFIAGFFSAICRLGIKGVVEALLENIILPTIPLKMDATGSTNIDVNTGGGSASGSSSVNAGSGSNVASASANNTNNVGAGVAGSNTGVANPGGGAATGATGGTGVANTGVAPNSSMSLSNLLNQFTHNPVTGEYFISDPAQQGSRGYVARGTGTNQPYAGNLAKALEHARVNNPALFSGKTPLSAYPGFSQLDRNWFAAFNIADGKTSPHRHLISKRVITSLENLH